MSTSASSSARITLSVFCDYREENWPSMDLAAEMLVAELGREPSVDVWPVVPTFRRRFQAIPVFGNRAAVWNADRMLNRMRVYPCLVQKLTRTDPTDFYHIVDHSYAHLLHELPADRTGVYCHDLDTFRCLLTPEIEPRPWWFRRMARRILDGFQRAAIVFYSTDGVRDQILRHNLVDSSRLTKAPLGHASEFTPAPKPDDDQVVPPGRFLLHVGSCIARKRIDVLLDVFRRLAEMFPDLTLVQVGGEWSSDDLDRLKQLDPTRVQQRRGIGRSELAALYRRAAVVLQPSQSEGFGLPVIEALACGAVVVASDIAPLREVGGSAAVFCPVGDVPQWTQTIAAVLQQQLPAPLLQNRIEQAARFTWAAHAATILQAYRALKGAA